MSKAPSFQFYPADWRNNAKLRRCSSAARGAWIDLICILHDSDEYGVCRWPLADLARAAGVPMKLVRELVEKDVLKGADQNADSYIYTPRHAGKDGEPVTLVEGGDGPCWYCSRLARDAWVRKRRGSGTQFTTENQPPKPEPKPAPNPEPKSPPKGGFGERLGDGPSSSSSILSSKEDNIPPYPHESDLPPKANATTQTGKPSWSPHRGWSGISDSMKAEWEAAYPACDIDRQLLRMEQWLKSNPAKAKKKNWLKFITNWLSNAQDSGGDQRTHASRRQITPFQPIIVPTSGLPEPTIEDPIAQLHALVRKDRSGGIPSIDEAGDHFPELKEAL